MVTLPKRNAYTAKDQVKSDKANKFIGQGSATSSTEAYRKAWGSLANCGEYSPTDIVFVSAEGARANRKAVSIPELNSAIAAGVTFITDDRANRIRAYNVGEREVARHLIANDYFEVEPGVWIPRL